METTTDQFRTVLEKIQISLPSENSHTENIFFLLGFLECAFHMEIIDENQYEEIYADYR